MTQRELVCLISLVTYHFTFTDDFTASRTFSESSCTNRAQDSGRAEGTRHVASGTRPNGFAGALLTS